MVRKSKSTLFHPFYRKNSFMPKTNFQCAEIESTTDNSIHSYFKILEYYDTMYKQEIENKQQVEMNWFIEESTNWECGWMGL